MNFRRTLINLLGSTVFGRCSLKPAASACSLPVFHACERRNRDGGDRREIILLFNAAQLMQEHLAVLIGHTDVGDDGVGTSSAQRLARLCCRAGRATVPGAVMTCEAAAGTCRAARGPIRHPAGRTRRCAPSNRTRPATPKRNRFASAVGWRGTGRPRKPFGSCAARLGSPRSKAASVPSAVRARVTTPLFETRCLAHDPAPGSASYSASGIVAFQLCRSRSH